MSFDTEQIHTRPFVYETKKTKSLHRPALKEHSS